MRQFALSLLALGVLTGLSAAQAASLQVAPVLLDVTTAGDAATSITLRNSGTRPINAQVRVFAWTQANGHDVLRATKDVAVSPPILSLRPNTDFTVRVVRVSGVPVRGEESYRLIADELPDPRAQRAGSVNLIVRQSVPVFFRSPDASGPSLSWSVFKSGGKLQVEATNEGDRRVRVTDLRVTNGSRKYVNYGNGLIGYVLGHSSAVFTSKSFVRGFNFGKVHISAQLDTGHLSTIASISARK